jgi:hypothetical protein
MPKHYTPSEANEMLTIVRPMVAELMTLAERIRTHQPEIWERWKSCFEQNPAGF